MTFDVAFRNHMQRLAQLFLPNWKRSLPRSVPRGQLYLEAAPKERFFSKTKRHPVRRASHTEEHPELRPQGYGSHFWTNTYQMPLSHTHTTPGWPLLEKGGTCMR